MDFCKYNKVPFTFTNIWVFCLMCKILQATGQVTTVSSFSTQCQTGLCMGNNTGLVIGQLRSKLECSALCTIKKCTSLSWKQDDQGSNVCTIYQSAPYTCLDSSSCNEGQYTRSIESFCYNGGTLDSGSCLCNPSYTGLQCETDLCPVDACDDLACSNFGTCTCLSGHSSCQCVAGFAGLFCDTDEGPATTSTVLEVDNGFYYGTWGAFDYCDTATFAYGFSQKVDSDGFFDETSVNAVALYCIHPISREISAVSPTSMMADWGDWENVTRCQADYYIVRFQMFAEPGNNDDDSSTNNIRVACRGPGLAGTDEYYIEGGGYDFGGEWGSWSVSCETGTAVCGIQTKVSPDQGAFNDDTALDDLKLQCCAF